MCHWWTVFTLEVHIHKPIPRSMLRSQVESLCCTKPKKKSERPSRSMCCRITGKPSSVVPTFNCNEPVLSARFGDSVSFFGFGPGTQHGATGLLRNSLDPFFVGGGPSKERHSHVLKGTQDRTIARLLLLRWKSQTKEGHPHTKTMSETELPLGLKANQCGRPCLSMLKPLHWVIKGQDMILHTTLEQSWCSDSKTGISHRRENAPGMAASNAYCAMPFRTHVFSLVYLSLRCVGSTSISGCELILCPASIAKCLCL